MNHQRWKGIVWLASVAVAGVLVFYVYDFLRNKEQLSQAVSNEYLDSVLNSVEKPPVEKTDVVEYEAIKRVFMEHDWTGKPPVKPVVSTPTGPVAAPKVAVATLLKVQAVRVDETAPENSIAYVKFTDPKLVLHVDKEDPFLKVDERLFPPYQDVRVEAITAEGVVFAFDDAAREKETVPVPKERGEGIVVVGEGGVIEPQLQRQIDSARPDLPPWRPEQLTQLRKNEWMVGTETLAELDRDYSLILSRDIAYSTYKNPRTGATEGLKITKVTPNSIPAQAGLTEGEILKSINGHRVTSVNDAIAFVKANANATDTWTAVFEKQGREFTRTYRSPPR